MLPRIGLLSLTIAALTAGSIAAIRVVPVSVLLGPCLKDWTNVNSYQHRPSPLATTTMTLGTGAVKVCYGRPSARGRAVFGGLVPWNRYWRLGANEPTRLFTNVPLRIAGIPVKPGRYSLYAIPGPEQWTVGVNRSTSHWGLDFSDRVLAQEVGRATVATATLNQLVETLVLRLEPVGRNANLIVEWERTRISIPLTIDN